MGEKLARDGKLEEDTLRVTPSCRYFVDLLSDVSQGKLTVPTDIKLVATLLWLCQLAVSHEFLPAEADELHEKAVLLLLSVTQTS